MKRDLIQSVVLIGVAILAINVSSSWAAAATSKAPSAAIAFDRKVAAEIDAAKKAGASEAEILAIMADSAVSQTKEDRIKDAGCDSMPIDASQDCIRCCDEVTTCNDKFPGKLEASARCGCYGGMPGCDQHTVPNPNKPPKYICESGASDGADCPDMTPKKNGIPPGSSPGIHNFADCHAQCWPTSVPQ